MSRRLKVGRAVALIFSMPVLAALLAGCGKAWNRGAEVVVYCAQDQMYAEPVLREFEKETGIHVRAAYDSEAVKTVGLANRLLAERAHPQCDVFWGNEEMRTRHLAAQDVFRVEDGVATFGYRTRRIVINTDRLTADQAPKSLLELTNATWRGKVVLAYPLFGTTATHFMALRQQWGEAGWEAWCRALAANEPMVVDGNSVVVRLVGRGEAWIGLTDSDDIAAGQREGMPVAAVSFEGMLYIPNTVAVVRNASRSEAAQKLYDYLRRPEVAQRLVAANALEGAEPSIGTGLQPDWGDLIANLTRDTETMRTIFLR